MDVKIQKLTSSVVVEVDHAQVWDTIVDTVQITEGRRTSSFGQATDS